MPTKESSKFLRIFRWKQWEIVRTQQVTLSGSCHFLYGRALMRFQHLYPISSHVVGIFRGCLAWRIGLLDP
jgi:hypothetical protein